MIQYVASTRRGTSRRENQDRVLMNDLIFSSGSTNGVTNDHVFAAVYDGVGGTPGGALAAEIAADSMVLYRSTLNSEASLRRAFLCANDRIRERQKQEMECAHMGTAVAGVLISFSEVYSFHTGDCRVYRYIGGDLELLSVDHTSGNSSHILTNQQEHSGVVTKYLGGSTKQSIPDIRHLRRSDNKTMYLILSDGMWKNLFVDEILRVLNNEDTLQEKNEALIRIALQNGSKDDCSLILISCVSG